MADALEQIREERTREILEREEAEYQKFVLKEARAMIVSQDQVILYATDKACSLFGYPDRYFQQKLPHLHQLIPERFRQIHDTHFEHYFKKPDPRPMGRRQTQGQDFIGLRRDGEEFRIEIALGELQMHKGEECVVILLSEAR